MERSRRARTAAFFAILAAAALFRIPCLRTEPWMDEIWSLHFARGAKSVADVLFGIHHDNNHPLNTLWLYLVRGSGDWAVWRLFSLACGLATVGVMALDDQDPPRGLLTAALAAGSAVLVLYSTEARGYAAAALCAVACHRLLSSGASPRPARVAAFAFFAALGFFGHPTFIFALAALGVWAAVALPPERRARNLCLLFGPAAVLGVAYELLQRGPLRIGAGAFRPFAPVAFRTLAQWSGAPDAGPAAVLGAATLAGLCAWELRRLRNERDDEFYFFAVLLGTVVAFVAILPFRYERYFFAVLPFALMLAGRSLLRLLRAGRAAKAAAVLMIGLSIAGGAVRVRTLATLGRGHYREAVQFMAAETSDDYITVGSDHAFRNGMLLQFYASYLPPSKRLVYVSPEGYRDNPPQWYLRHTFDTDPRLAPTGLLFGGKTAYALAGIYPYSGLSGWTWLLYRRTTAI
ncbi:MAG: hypothetical protein ACHQ51_15390 [Elusimicrobiota bacterium]